MNLREWRLKHEVTLADLSRALGVSIGQLSHLELGKRKWSVDLAKKTEAYTKGVVTAASLLGVRTGRRVRGVREDSAPFGETEFMALEIPIELETLQRLRAQGVDVEAVARAGAEKAIKEADARAWADANRDAIEASNRWIEKHGTLAEQLGLI
jgi:antitoxin CcdA